MPFFTTADRAVKTIAPGADIRTFWGDNMTLSVVDLAANSSVPLHSHSHEQAGIVLEGEMDFTIGDETRRLQVGDLYIVPGHVVHGVEVGSQPARALDIFSPVRDEYKY